MKKTQAAFIARNPRFAIKNPRRSWAVVKAMREFAAEVGVCQFKGCRSRDRFNPAVHHVKPVSMFPELAADKSNLFCACDKHHFAGCHPCSYHDAVENVRELAEAVELVEPPGFVHCCANCVSLGFDATLDRGDCCLDPRQPVGAVESPEGYVCRFWKRKDEGAGK